MSWLSFGLWPLHCLYAVIQWLRRGLYARGILRSYKLAQTTISIGNLEVGGTGKSPVVIALCSELCARGARPAILTRGYKSGLDKSDSAVYFGEELLLSPRHQGTWQADEARMQASRLQKVPVIIGADRLRAAERYLQSFPAPTHWVLDDGYQHLRLQRQHNLLLLDATRPFDNGLCLPAGRLREPLSALRAADWILFTRANPEKMSSEIPFLSKNPCIRLSFSEEAPRQVGGPLRAFEQCSTVALILGLAKPERLLKHCQEQNYPITETYFVGDHQSFDLTRLEELKSKVQAFLLSEKDFYRQKESLLALQLPLFVLPLSVSPYPLEHWLQLIESIMKQ